MNIAAAGEADLARVLAIDPHAVEGSRRRQFLAEAVAAGQCILARIEGDVIAGFVVLDRSFFDQRFISLLHVDEQYRRQGIGLALVRHVMAASGGEKLFTSTNQSNVPMQRLCERLGFRRSGSIENLDEGDPEIIYFRQS